MPRQYPGPPISQAQEEEQKFKKYPNMMPAKGTFMFWFLNSKLLHMGICLSVLISLVVFMFVEDFVRTTPYLDQLPPGREFFFHPFSFIATYGKVYKAHTLYIGAKTAEKRKKMADDVPKRSRYRRAHGLEDAQGFGRWTAKSDTESSGPALPTRDLPGDDGSPKEPGAQSTYVASERKRRPVKRWLGIWE